ncbi:MAG: gliding motility lipoprotein GldD [Flavobacteriaceae bacterium]|nr:gliding motility lipoprotein GldD [Flavobacteriaceae bacterium]
MKNSALFIFVLCVFMWACGDAPVPKPKAQLRLEYPQVAYLEYDSGCNYSFVKNQLAEIKKVNSCNINIHYKDMKGTIFLTYKKVDNNLRELLVDAQKITFEHSAKADGFVPHPFANKENKVYGVLYEVEGDAASQAQFYVTDSLKHFLSGSLYFYRKPNYDSILPAAAYLKNDMRTLMESITWKEMK